MTDKTLEQQIGEALHHAADEARKGRSTDALGELKITANAYERATRNAGMANEYVGYDVVTNHEINATTLPEPVIPLVFKNGYDRFLSGEVATQVYALADAAAAVPGEKKCEGFSLESTLTDPTSPINDKAAETFAITNTAARLDLTWDGIDEKAVTAAAHAHDLTRIREVHKLAQIAARIDACPKNTRATDGVDGQSKSWGEGSLPPTLSPESLPPKQQEEPCPINPSPPAHSATPAVPAPKRSAPSVASRPVAPAPTIQLNCTAGSTCQVSSGNTVEVKDSAGAVVTSVPANVAIQPKTKEPPKPQVGVVALTDLPPGSRTTVGTTDNAIILVPPLGTPGCATAPSTGRCQ